MENTITEKGKMLWVSDMDGTLMGADSHVSATSAGIIAPLVQRGLLFTVATARTPATAVPLVHDLHLQLPLIVMAGAAMWDSRTGRYRDVQRIDEDVVSRVADIFAVHGLVPLVYRCHDERFLVAHHHGPLSAPELTFVAERRHLAMKRFDLDSPDLGRDAGGETLIIFAMNEYATMERLHRDITAAVDCEAVLSHDIFDPSVGLLEIYRRGCTKAAAIGRLAAMTGATQVTVYGDNINDLPMLAAATHAVAVANAVPEVLAAADEVIGPNTADAVAHHLAAQASGLL